MYPIAFREAAMRLYNFHGSLRKTAIALKVSIASLSRWHKNIEPKKRIRRPIKLTDAIVQFIAFYTSNNVSTTCLKIKVEVERAFDVKISKQLAHLALKKSGYTFKRIRKRGESKNKHTLYKSFQEKFLQAVKDHKMVVAIDESGFDHQPFPIYGYSLKGQQAILNYKPLNDRKRYSLIMATSCDGKKYYNITDSSVNGTVFSEFILNLPFPTNSVILLDNASIHKTKVFQATALKKGYSVLFIPPYSPECNPIELVFGIIKNKYYKSRYCEHSLPIHTVVQDCVNEIETQTVTRCFKHVENYLKTLYI